ncbi:hypothetical protein SAMN05877753_101360 [Bacillus oleivorans]|uniref:Endonuclease/exonuclease/phosphatase family protein n=1 Tax=Bacillus oleivorans TaxID=1448271 RepID=A0A285CJ65_9BACI|nr:hypothetical protein [Bacillus oleivorans]SNX67046.1 hypothetical protein SAMN05877753_101360 [Bacillus oleivorans]
MASFVLYSWNPGGETGKKDGFQWSLDDVAREMKLFGFPDVMVFQEAGGDHKEIKEVAEGLSYQTEYIQEVADAQPQYLLKNKSYLWAWDEKRVAADGASVHVNCDPYSNEHIMQWIRGRDPFEQGALTHLALYMRWPVYKRFKLVGDGRTVHLFSLHGSLKKDFAGVLSEVNCKIGLIETVEIFQRSDLFLEAAGATDDIVLIAGDFNLNAAELETGGVLDDFYLVASEEDGAKWCHILAKGNGFRYAHMYARYPDLLRSYVGVHQVMGFKMEF